MQKRSLHIYNGITGVLLMDYFQRRLQCKRRLFRITKSTEFYGAKCFTASKEYGSRKRGRASKRSSKSCFKVPGAMAGKASGTAVKATVLKILAGGITAAVIGTAGFFGGRMIKNHQAKKETTQTQNGQNNQDKSNKQNGQNSSGASDNQGSAGKNTKGSSKQFVNNNEAFVKEMLTLTVNSNTLVQDNKEKSLRDAVDVSMMLMYDSNSSNEGDSEIWNVVSKDQVKDTKADNQGGSISVQESAFDKMKQF